MRSRPVWGAVPALESVGVFGCARLAPGPAGGTALLGYSEVSMRGATGADRLLRGFYESNGDCRPTAKAFAVSLDPPEAGATYLRLDCGILAESISTRGPVTLAATVNGVEVGRETYSRGARSCSSETSRRMP